MIKSLSAAAIAISLIAGPAFAQGNVPPLEPVTTQHGVKPAAHKANAHKASAHKPHRHVAHVKHTKTTHKRVAKRVKHVKPVNSAKRIRHQDKVNTTG